MFDRLPPRRVAFACALLCATLAAQADQRVWNPYYSSANPRASASTDEETAAVRQLNWRRSTMGLPALQAESAVTLAAQRHSAYLSLNNITGHGEVSTRSGFTGADPGARLQAAGYGWQTYGEVVSAGQATGPLAVESLMEAIYHRFGMLRSDVNHTGAGFRTDHPTYHGIFTMNFGAQQRQDSLAGQGWLGMYPVTNQNLVPIDFYSDNESPDPVSNANRVGYPISVHAASSETLSVNSFRLSQSGTTVPTLMLLPGVDGHTPHYASALIPLQPLTPGATYTATFSGTAGGRSVSQSWNFTTAPQAAIRTLPATLCYAPGSSGGRVTLSGGSGTFTNIGWSNSAVVSVSFVTGTQLQITPRATGTATLTVTDSSNGTAQFTLNISDNCAALTSSDQVERLLNWAESTYARFFLPAGGATVTGGGYSYRYYPLSNTYLGVSNGTVYFMDAYLAPSAITPVGSMEQFMPLVAQDGF